MPYSESIEDYLETILVIEKRKGRVKCVDIAEEMGYSKASVSVALRRMRGMGLLAEGLSTEVIFTSEGRDLAERIYERHVLFAQMLHALGVDEATAAADACRMEHAISDKSFAAIKSLFDQVRAGEPV